MTRATPAAPPEGTVEDFRVVGVGASAGGLESLEHLFANLPANPGMAFVVVQHLSPDFRSLMDELLSRYSRMPVTLARHGERVEPDHVYLLPPRKQITLHGGRLCLTEKDASHGLTLPIDLFFVSLAEDLGARAVAIVLSGSGSDGSRGLCAVKRAGGLVLVEDPATAQFDGMPMSAVATGLVDHVAAAAEIPSLLLGSPPAPPIEAPDSSPLESVFRLLRTQFGLDFSIYKTTTVSRRLLRRVAMQPSAELQDYVEQLRSDPEELSSLYRDLLIGVTRFFRDPEAFAVLERVALPELLERVPEGDEIRVWVAGCATGEEAYSVAILLHEQLVRAERPVKVRILATDVHRASLETASQGLYAEEQLEHVSEERRARFFVRKGDRYQVSPDLRSLVVFAPHDITKDAPFTKMHLVTCRNVLIYIEPTAQKAVLSLFHFGLVTQGLLFLGPSESPGPLQQEFAPLDEHWKVYRKKRDIRLLEPLRTPRLRPGPPGLRSPILAARPASQDRQLLTTYDQLLNRYMPPALLVDEDRVLVDSFGGAERFLRVGPRRPSTHVLDLVEGDLRTVLAGALQRALKTGAEARYDGVPVPGRDEARWTLRAEPFSNPRSGAVHVLLTFLAEDRAVPPVDTPERPETASPALPHRVEALEGELAHTRETLQATIEELQTSNEELQAANEELVASNEELQSTNEELHSVNEELYSVNAEYQKKIQELRELNGDMQHLLEGTDVGMLFLDADLRIRRFTPRVAGVFRLRDHDVGREIVDFSHRLARPELFEEIRRTLRDGVRLEEEVRDEAGTTWFLRLLPYRPLALPDASGEGDGPIEGVVLSLTDISALAGARSRVDQLSAIVESSEEAIVGWSLDGTVTTWNRGAERLYGWSAAEVLDRHLKVVGPPGGDLEIEALLERVARDESIERIESVRTRKDGTRIEVSLTVSPIRDRDGALIGVSTVAHDLTELKRAQAELAVREARLRLILDSTAEAILGLDRDGTCTFCNPACARLLGHGAIEDLVGRRFAELVQQVRGDQASFDSEGSPVAAVLRTGQGTHSDAQMLLRADGSAFPAEVWCYPARRGDRLEGAVVTFLDITERKRAEDEIHAASRRREQFLAMLSHELRNPLAAVLSATRVLRDLELAEGAKAARAVIERQSTHMARLLDDLLDVSRITRGGIELRKESLDLGEVARAALEAVTPLFAGRAADLRVELADEPLPVRGDPARLQQVLVNLLSNAARYSTPGSPIQLEIGRAGEVVRTTVTDQGCGIEPEMLTAIFELFVQARQGLDRSRGGLGVGLTLVRTIVDLHGGRVQATSDGPGRGSTFVVELPLHRRALAEAEHDGPVPRRVVLVEDQADTRQMLRLLLESRGHLVTEVADGTRALAVIEREQPDVALIDIGLPVMSGYDVARRLRRNPVVDDVYLVALTGYGTADDVRTAYAAGFDAHLTKPAEPERIVQIVDRCRSR